MNLETFNSTAMKLVAGLIVCLWVIGAAQIAAGLMLGSLMVIGLMITVEQIPGFWRMALWGPGTLIVVFGTAWLTHAVFGAHSIVGMTAVAWSLIFKVIVIEAKRGELQPTARRW